MPKDAKKPADHQHLHDLLDEILQSANEHMINAIRVDLEVFREIQTKPNLPANE